MKIASVLIISVLFLFYTYDIVSLFYEVLFPMEGIVIATYIITGTLVILFGISIITSAKRWGILGYVAGGFEIFTAICCLTVLFVLGGLFTQFPAIILQVILLVKIRQMKKE